MKECGHQRDGQEQMDHPAYSMEHQRTDGPDQKENNRQDQEHLGLLLDFIQPPTL
jgi:hypothetical protein